MLEGDLDDVNFVVFSPDGKQVVSRSWDKTVRALERWHGSGTADARGPLERRQLRGLLTRHDYSTDVLAPERG